MTTEEETRLLVRAVAGDLTPDEAARLAAECRQDEALLGRLSRLVLTERLLSHGHLYADDGAFVREVQARLESEAAAEAAAAPVVPFAPVARGRAGRFPVWAWGAAAALVLGALGWAGWQGFGRGAPDAQIVRMESATWEPGQVPPKVGDAVEARRLRLAGGLAELKFARGATVIVEGPADFEVRGPEQAILRRGRAVTRLPKGTKGFVLDSPRGRLVDQGTEFGVSVGPSGDTEVHVLEGKVEAVPSNRSEPMQLTENQGARMTTQRIEAIAADAAGFITDLPPPAPDQIGYLHWSFDEGQGAVSYNRGTGLGKPQARALLKTFPGEGPGPQWIAGQAGAGLAFDGKDDFVECEFPGIAGGEPRTVAFWVKVPRDSGIGEGYGIVNWGTSRPGLAWQISVNPAAHEGPLGRLRLGVHESFVVGTTDLRDDRWHHCAVVMYGGHRPDAGTHILLYLDGELEPAARKAVGEIRTQITGADAHNMWLGRNLGYRSATQAYPLGRFFRGAIDEVFVFNAALDQEQIRSVMKHGRLMRPVGGVPAGAP